MRQIKIIAFVTMILLIMSSPCYAEWAVNYGGSFSEKANSIHQTQDGGFIVAGGYGYLITKFNPDGTVNWQKEYTLEPTDEAQSIKQTQNGGYIVAGTSSYYYADEIWILKLHPDGNAEWQKTYVGDDPWHKARAYSVKETFDLEGNPNGYIVAGSTIHLTGGSWDIWVLKLNLDGTIDWQKTYNRNTDGAYSIEQTFDPAGNPDGYIVAGSSGSPSNAWLLRLNIDGSIKWDRLYGGSSSNAISIQQTQEGGFIVAGPGGAAELAPGRHFWVAKLDSYGLVDWQKVYGGANSEDVPFSVEEVLDSSGNPNGYVVAGETSNFGAGQKDVWVLKLDLNGIIEWEKTYGGSINESANSIQQTFDQIETPNGYAVAGYTWSFGTGRDAFVLKLNANGEIPDCNLMGTSQAIVSDGTWWFYDNLPTAIVQDSEANLLDTNIVPNEPNYPTAVICEWSQECGNDIVEPGEDCDDGNTLSGDCCNEYCLFEPAGSPCLDSQFCNGDETCDGAGTCQPGTPPDCSDGVACTDDSCDVVNDACKNTPNDANCPDDGLFCNGTESCDLFYGCVSSGDPCPPGMVCNEDADTCDDALDLDIARFSVTKMVKLTRVKPIKVKLVVENNGSIEGSGMASVVGVQDSAVIYTESMRVSGTLSGGPTTWFFPEYTPVVSGDIMWTATIDDDDADVDEAVAVTTVK